LQRFNFFCIEDVASVDELESIDSVVYASTAFKRVDTERGLILFVYEFKSTHLDLLVPSDYVLGIMEEPSAKTIVIVAWSFNLEFDMVPLLYREFLISITSESQCRADFIVIARLIILRLFEPPGGRQAGHCEHRDCDLLKHFLLSFL